MIRKMKKLLFVVAIISIFNSFIVFGAREGMRSAGGGDADKEQMYNYVQEDGTLLKNQWKQVWDNWYYFGEKGDTKQNTWAEIEGNWYYFDQWSVMLHDTTTPDGHSVGSDGVWIPAGNETAPVQDITTNN